MLGEIYLCQFPFTAGTASKLRPALVLFDLATDVIICRVTSVSHSGPLDLAIKDWQHAGLIKPSVARLNRLMTAERRIFLRRLGTLHANDVARIKALWNQHMRL